MRERVVETVADGSFTEAGATVHPTAIAAAPPGHEFVDRDVLLNPELLEPPGVAQHILDDLELGDVLNAGGDIYPVDRHAEVVRFRRGKAGKRRRALLILLGRRHSETSCSLAALEVVCYARSCGR